MLTVQSKFETETICYSKHHTEKVKPGVVNNIEFVL